MPSSSSRHPRFFPLTAALVLLAGCQAPRTDPATATTAAVERGRYLVTAGVCDDCHTPKVFTANGPVPDSSRRLSGHPAGAAVPELPSGLIGPERWGAIANPHFTAWAGPWGVSFTANLTPHETGLGGWSPDVFIQTIRKGKHAGVGRDLLPPMPWPMYANLSDEDLAAIFAYLQSLPPVENRVPAPLPPKAGG